MKLWKYKSVCSILSQVLTFQLAVKGIFYYFMHQESNELFQWYMMGLQANKKVIINGKKQRPYQLPLTLFPILYTSSNG